MSIERIVAETSAGPMLGGLDWRPPSNGVHSGRALQEAKSHTDSTHVTLFESRGLVRYGLYKSRVSEESLKLPKGVVSAAACFAQLVGGEFPNAALVLPVESAIDDRSEPKYLVIVLEDGVPHIDTVVNEMSARDTIGSEERPLWAASESKYPNCRVANFEWLASGAHKSARVLRIPINPWPILAFMGLSVVAAVAWHTYQQADKAEKLRRQAAEAAAADPAPKYLSALIAQAPGMAARRSDVIQGLQQMFNLGVAIPGWKLAYVECSSQEQRCLLNWSRRGGTFEDIKDALPTHTLIPVRPQGSPVPLVDTATTLTEWPVSRESLIDDGTRPPTMDTGLEQVMPLLQTWQTAGVEIQFNAPELWPLPAGVPKEFRHPASLRRGQLVLSGIPGPFIEEVLATAPRWIQWDRVRADLGESTDARSRLSFKVTGTYYVSSQ